MSLVKASNRVYYLPGNSETDQPFVYYIKGDNYSAAVDAGQSKQQVEAFYEAIKAEKLSLPKLTLITHWHWDHTFGLPYITGTSIANEKSKQKLNEVSKWLWTPELMKKRERTGEDISFCNECIQKVYPDLSEIKVKSIDQGITEPMTLDLGGIHLQLFPMDSIHSRDALLIYSPEEKALFIGDADGEDHYEEHGNMNPDRIAAYTEFIRPFDFEQYYMGHDFPDNKEGVMNYLEDARKRYEKE